jgi:diguanylate cyclase (GGDEF)-like protein
MSVAQRDLARADPRYNTPRLLTIPDRFADSREEPFALDSSQQKLEAAMRQNDELHKTRSLLTKKVSSLEFALAKANQFAHYDELTGLPNRRLLLDRFIQAAALANRHHDQLALLFFDVNDFKCVNDNLGHAAGDKLLQQVATRLSNSIRQSDTACRFGGDEFVVLLTEIADREHVLEALKKVRAELAPPSVVDRYSLRLTVSDGLAIYPEDAQCFADLIHLSDRSMFSTKSGNRRQTDDVRAENIWMHDAENVLCSSH